MTSQVDVAVDVGMDLLARMLRIRRFEERVEALTKTGELMGAHLYTGEEAIAAGVCAALRERDYITSTHRCHGHVIAKGADLSRCMAELFARETGYCRGKGGEMHIADVGLGIVGANGIVGAGMPLALGAALAGILRHTDQVSVAFFVAVASAAGAFHESLNLATVWSLPVVFVCENNGWSEWSRMERVLARGGVVQHAEGDGIPGTKVDGNDAWAVYEAASAAITRARAGGGPSLIEAMSYRLSGHGGGDDRAFVGQYRGDEELDEWRSRDPIARMQLALTAAGVVPHNLHAVDSQTVSA